MNTVLSAPRSKPVSTFLADGPKRLFVNGQWIPSRQAATFSTRDPGAGDVLAEVFSADAHDVDSAVAAARVRPVQNGGYTPVVDEDVHRMVIEVQQRRMLATCLLELAP